MSSVVENLLGRIEEGKSWLESDGHLEIDGHAVRGYPTSVQLVEFLDDPKRIERNGLGFLVTVRSSKSEKSFQINVRVKAGVTEGPKDTSVPYVVVYVVDLNTGADDEIFCEHFPNWSTYAPLADLNVRDWYAMWVNRALRTESGKFFARLRPKSQDGR